MPSHPNDINRVQAPIDLAMKMFLEQQAQVSSIVLGPPAPRTRASETTTVHNLSLDTFLAGMQMPEELL